MTNNKCLNCEKVLVDRFCSGCGQKADTHRISFKNFFTTMCFMAHFILKKACCSLLNKP